MCGSEEEAGLLRLAFGLVKAGQAVGHPVVAADARDGAIYHERLQLVRRRAQLARSSELAAPAARVKARLTRLALYRCLGDDLIRQSQHAKCRVVNRGAADGCVEVDLDEAMVVEAAVTREVLVRLAIAVQADTVEGNAAVPVND